MGYVIDKEEIQRDFAGVSSDQQTRFDKLMGATPWLLISTKEHADAAKAILSQARQEGFKIDLLLFDMLDAEPGESFKHDASSYRHILFLASAPQPTLTDRIRTLIPATALMELDVGNSEAVMTMLRSVPRCC